MSLRTTSLPKVVAATGISAAAGFAAGFAAFGYHYRKELVAAADRAPCLLSLQELSFGIRQAQRKEQRLQERQLRAEYDKRLLAADRYASDGSPMTTL